MVLHETPGAALVDGRDGLGGVVAEFCMELAISKARRVGVAWVTARNSNHFGIAGHYSLMAGELGWLVAGEGVTAADCCREGGAARPQLHQRLALGDGHAQRRGQGHVHQPRQLHRARHRPGHLPLGVSTISTQYLQYLHNIHTISILQDSLVLDMATATVAVGKLEVAAVNNQQIPGGWAVDGRGRQTQARAFTRQGHLMTGQCTRVTCHVSHVALR